MSAAPIDVLRCTCGACRLPFAKIINGALVIESVHHGERHRNAIGIDHLLRLLSEQPERERPSREERPA